MRKFSLYSMFILYLLAGSNHFINPAMYLTIMPAYIGWHAALVFISGVFEMILALLLLPISSRRLAAWGIIALLIAVFPANIQMAINYNNEAHPGFWLAALRLPLQVLLIWWAYSFTKKDWVNLNPSRNIK